MTHDSKQTHDNIVNKEYKGLTSPPKPRSPELGAEVVVLGEAVAVPDVLAPELHWQ